jgi:hypothetical protein
MTTAVQLRRGTTAEHATFTGLEGETTVDTTKTTLVVHNGSTAGGFAIAREDLANVSPTNLPVLTGADTASDDKFLIYDQSALTLKQITRAELNTAITQGTLSNVQIISGTINGTTIGGTTAAAGSFTTLNSSGATTLNGTTIPSSVTLVSTAATQTLTNKTISGANNTLSNIANSSLTNSSITFGSTAQALGSTVSALNGVSIGATTASTGAFTNLAYTGTLTGGTGVINIGSGQLYKDASGNVGIGTSSPANRLTGKSLTIAESGAASSGLEINVGGSSGGELFSNAASTILNEFRALPLIFRTSNTERMRIDSAGNVGIGTSSPGTVRLVIRGNAATEAVGVRMEDTNAAGRIYSITSDVGSLNFRDGTANAERMRIDSSGNLLVGTTVTITGAANAITPSRNLNGGGIVGPTVLNTQFQTPSAAGTFTITLGGTAIKGVLDVAVFGNFNSDNREGYAAYKVFFSRTTGSVTTITVQSPTNAGGSFTTSFTFTASKPDANTLTIVIGKPSGATYSVCLSGQFVDFSSDNSGRLTSISSSFV